MTENILISEEASAKGTERTLAILELLGRFRKGQSSSEIARTLGLPVNTVGRITETMTKRGWLYRREDDRRYVLTNRVADLTRPQVNDKSLVVSSWDALKELRDRTGETTQLLAMSEGKTLILEQCVSDQAIKVSGITGIALTKLDILDGLEELKICTGYRLNGEILNYFPAGISAQAGVEPIYETLEGWQESTYGARSWGDLPATAIKYIRRIEELIEAPVAMLSTSPERDDTILVNDPFAG